MNTVARNFLITLLLAFAAVAPAIAQTWPAKHPMAGTPQQAADYVRAEVVKWGKVVRDTGAKPD